MCVGGGRGGSKSPLKGVRLYSTASNIGNNNRDTKSRTEVKLRIGSGLKGRYSSVLVGSVSV